MPYRFFLFSYPLWMTLLKEKNPHKNMITNIQEFPKLVRTKGQSIDTESRITPDSVEYNF